MLLHFEDEQDYAARLATAAGLVPSRIERHRFPDGELKLRLPTPLPSRVALLRSLHDPNEKLVELLLAARTARELGATELTLVAPYLAYMRQDAAFAPGEAVSQRIIGGWLAQLFDHGRDDRSAPAPHPHAARGNTGRRRDCLVSGAADRRRVARILHADTRARLGVRAMGARRGGRGGPPGSDMPQTSAR